MRRRPSPSMMVALLALFIALGGTSYAVIKLPASSVGNRELKRDAVTASKIRDGSIGSAELTAEASPRRGPRGPQGPAGAPGAPGTSGGVLVAPEPWQPLAFAGTWSNYGTNGHVTAAYRKDQFGHVYLRGLVTKLGGGDEVLGTLPPGYRPAARLMFAVSMCATSADAGRLDVYPSGDVARASGAPCEPDYLSLDTISFWTDQ